MEKIQKEDPSIFTRRQFFRTSGAVIGSAALATIMGSQLLERETHSAEKATKEGPMSEPQGVLAIWNDVDPQNEVEYNEWYFQQHILERLGVPGFLTARRYEAVGPGLKYFTYYMTSSVNILKSPAYLVRVNNPTDWTRRCMPLFKNMSRSACRETINMGRGIGGAATTLEIKAAAGREDDLRQRLASSLFPELLRFPGTTGVIRALLWEADPEVTTQKTSEQALRGGKDRVADWVIVLETSSVAEAEKASKFLAAYPFTAWGADSVAQPRVYRLMHHLQGPDGR